MYSISYLEELIKANTIKLKGEYKLLRGMYPTAAGKLASHGPYAKVSDIYRIPNLTRKYRAQLLIKLILVIFNFNPVLYVSLLRTRCETIQKL